MSVTIATFWDAYLFSRDLDVNIDYALSFALFVQAEKERLDTQIPAANVLEGKNVLG